MNRADILFLTVPTLFLVLSCAGKRQSAAPFEQVENQDVGEAKGIFPIGDLSMERGCLVVIHAPPWDSGGEACFLDCSLFIGRSCVRLEGDPLDALYCDQRGRDLAAEKCCPARWRADAGIDPGRPIYDSSCAQPGPEP